MPQTIHSTTKQGVVWKADVLPECGANCIRLTVTFDHPSLPADTAQALARGHGSGEDWKACRQTRVVTVPIFEDVPRSVALRSPTSFGMPILFPYAGRVAGGCFPWGGRRWRVDPTRHGLVRNRTWEVVEHQPSRIVCQTTVTPSGQDDCFPFHFTLRVSYQLGELGLIAAVEVCNRGGPFPYTFGFHPYFQCSAASSVLVPAWKRWELTADKIPTGEPVAVSYPYDLRGNPQLRAQAYDDVYTELVGNRDGLVRCVLSRSDGEVSISFSRSDYSHLCVYTPPDRPAICLEPYTGAPDALHHPDDPRFGLRVLPAGQTVAFGPITINWTPADA